MKVNTIKKAILAVITTAVMATTTQAKTGDMQFYTALKAGMIKLNPTLENTDGKAINTGLKFDKPKMVSVSAGVITAKNFGAEFDYLASTETKIASSKKDAKFTMRDYGLYGTYYLPVQDDYYLKGKLGYAQVNIKHKNKKQETKTRGVAGGFGLGYNITPKISLESEYTRLPTIKETNDGKVLKVGNDQVTFGARFKF